MPPEPAPAQAGACPKSHGGLILTLLYAWRGRLTACIVAHALWNTLATVAIYVWY